MIHYNNVNNVHYCAVNTETFETIEYNTVLIGTLSYTRKPYSNDNNDDQHMHSILCIM